MLDKITQLIEYNSEGVNLDYKQTQYPLGSAPKKAEILKDISAMANHPSNEDKFIIIGVIEKDGVADSFKNVTDLEDEANYQQYLRANIEPSIQFEYKAITYNGKTLAYFRIFGNMDRPYLFKTQIKDTLNQKAVDYRIGDGYIKTGSSTKKIDRKDLDLIYKQKYESKDRKLEVSVIPSIGTFTKGELRGLNYIDVKVVNSSNEAIHFEIELKIDAATASMGLSEDVRQQLYTEESKRLKKKDPYGMALRAPNIYIPNRDFTLSADNQSFTAKRLNKGLSSSSVTIAQQDEEAEIFNHDLIIIPYNGNKIKGVVTLRSNDFSTGPLIIDFELDV
ncbi:AlbA family DNA-binding domain-containing protein [Pedobacter hiemivivus]|uniref:ATP-binding protein n=1 Tax=Pedobacter hiemivivus TaxID=2530454 RepID=A0A4R0NFA4_9SPHI|nr:ATP-binding protein [Pedobacter hiemivivus]TCC98828.1 ATP-binding protein [Pedobacter hiemivivus]